MNSYERVMTALAVKEPDRLPILEISIDPKAIKALCPQAESQTDFEAIMDFDVVCCGAQYHRIAEYSDGSFMDEWHVLYKPGPEVNAHPIKGPIATREDLKNWTPPDPDAPHRLCKLRELIQRFKHKKAVMFHQRVAFMWSAYLNGIDNLLMNFLTDPEFAHALMDKVLAVNLRLAGNAIRAGADIISLGDDYASNDGPMFSPTVFKEFILPRLQKMVDTVHEERAKVMKHSDGNLWPILDMIINTGIDALNPIEPVAGMDIGEVKQKYGKRVCLIGNIDCGHLLPEGTPEEVEAAVKDCIRKASPGGGHIICSSNSIHSSVRPENYLAMIEATRKYGKYPIRVEDLN